MNPLGSSPYQHKIDDMEEEIEMLSEQVADYKSTLRILEILVLNGMNEDALKIIRLYTKGVLK